VAKSSLDALAPAGQVEFSNSEGRLSNDASTVDANELSIQPVDNKSKKQTRDCVATTR